MLCVLHLRRFLLKHFQIFNLTQRLYSLNIHIQHCYNALEKLKVEGVQINVIRYQAGQITESDIILANASNAILYGFNVRPDANIRQMAEEKKVDLRLHRIIYALIEEIEAALKGMRKKEEVEAEPVEEKKPEDIQLLEEIRDVLSVIKDK